MERELSPHPAGAARYCKRCASAFYGTRCAAKHQNFSFSRVIPLGTAVPEWALAVYGAEDGGKTLAEGQLRFATGDAITILPHPGPDSPGAGWTYGATVEGDVGLVPTSYIERQYTGPASPSPKGGAAEGESADASPRQRGQTSGAFSLEPARCLGSCGVSSARALYSQ
jgi:hypothetical protein